MGRLSDLILKNVILFFRVMALCKFGHFKLVSKISQSKKISNDQELIQSDPISCPQNQKGNN